MSTYLSRLLYIEILLFKRVFSLPCRANLSSPYFFPPSQGNKERVNLVPILTSQTIIIYAQGILNLFLISAIKLKDIRININKLLILIIINCIHIGSIGEFPCRGRFQTCRCAGIINKKTLHKVS